MLVINAAEDRLQILLTAAEESAGKPGQKYHSMTLAVPKKAIIHLAPAIAHLLDVAAVQGQDLSGIACVRGPGSFTGLRIAMAHTLGLAIGWNIPMAGLDYLPLLAAGPGPLLSGTLWVTTHARRNQVYLQPFACPDLTPLAEPLCPTLDQLKEITRTFPPDYVLGSGLVKNPTLAQTLFSKCTILPSRWNTPSFDVLMHSAKEASFSHNAPQPLYLRASDAEENLEAICKERGIDPTSAQQNIPDFLT